MDEPAKDYRVKLRQVLSNLRGWHPNDWLLFWIVIPALLLMIYALPQGVRNAYFILNTSELWKIQTIFLSSYTHSQLYPHLLGNVRFYLAALAVIFVFEDNHRRFWIMVAWAFLAVPFVSSFLTIIFWSLLGRNTTGQGFSAIDGAFLAYAIFIFVIWGVSDMLKDLDHPEYSAGSKRRYNIQQIVLGALFALIVITGIQFGQFTDTGNGIVHFGGFITSLATLLIFDVKTEGRRYVNEVLGHSIIIGIIWYTVYLIVFFTFVKSG